MNTDLKEIVRLSKIFEGLDHCNEASCDFCPHLHQTHERYPYGETTVSQALFECRCHDATKCRQAIINFTDEDTDND